MPTLWDSPYSTARRVANLRASIASLAELRLNDPGLVGSFVLGLFALILMWLGTAYISQQDYNRTEAAAYRDTGNLARAFEEHIIRLFQAHDQILLFVRSAYTKDPQHFDLVQWAKDQQFATDVALQVAIADKDGLTIASNLPIPTPAPNLGDRKHFRVHVGTDRDELFISEPVIGRVSGKPSIQLSRRINAADGSLAGVVILSLDPAYLASFYDAVDSNKKGSVALVGLDGVIRAYAAGPIRNINKSLESSSLLDRVAHTDAGTFLSRGQLDGTHRLSSYRRVKGYPLAVVVGFSQDEVFAAVHRNRLIYYGAAAFVSVLILVFMSLVLKHQVGLRRARDRLNESEAQYRSVVNGIREVIFQTDAATSLAFINKAWTDVMGFAVEDSLKHPLLGYVHPDDQPAAVILFGAIPDSDDHLDSLELRFVTKTGEVRWMELAARPTFDHQGQFTGMAGTLTDVTARREAESALRDSEFKFRSMFDTAPVGIALTGAGGELLEVNSAFAALCGRNGKELQTLTFADLLPSEQREKVEEYRAQAPHDRQAAPIECDIIGSDASQVTVLLNSAPASSSERLPLAWSIIQDISERKRVEMKIWEAAKFDALTHLPNRQMLHDVLDEIIADPDKRNANLTLLLVDLDNFKIINDTFGHEAGDLVLCAAAERISSVAGDAKLVARLGGDEFTILLHGKPGEIDRTVQGILSSLRRRMNYRGRAVEMFGSIGIARFPDHAATRSDLFRAADLALYRAKHDGRNRAAVFEPAMLIEAETKFEVLSSVRSAIKENRLVPFYQPEICIESGEISGFEALARIIGRDGRLTMPGEFMAAFQDPEVGRCLGLKMLELVARDLQSWLSAGLDVKRIAINASNLELKVDDYSDRVMSVLQARGIDFRHFEIEVTETVAFGDDSLSIGRNLSALATQGISLALDDFGTGFASLTHLKSLPISRVKIDQSFIRNIVSDQQSYSIVDAVVRLCHSLGKSVVAEGIEDEMQLEAIGGLRCDVVQGYFFARPMAAEAVGPFMLRHVANLAANGPPLQGIRRQSAKTSPLKVVGS
ncbi:MAG: hypothetical protein QOD40_1112 [Alphaproteobacteria bacterium]|nr:hypothetical protein [Alphaproteobacteria bacterium]